MPKFFTLQEAEKLIPVLQERLSQAIDFRNEAVEMETELQALTARIQMIGGLLVDPVSVAQKKHQKSRAAQLLHDAMREIEDFGCILKDLDVGLIDFPSMHKDEEVFLCWKLGESRIGYWHRADEGFAGRKPIGGDFGAAEGDPSAKPN